MLWLAWYSIQTTETFSTSAIKLFHFLIICVFTELALFISFKNFSLTFTTWLTDWCKRPSFQPVSAFNMLSSLSSIISSFRFKFKRCAILPFFSELRGHCRVINWLNFNIFCFIILLWIFYFFICVLALLYLIFIL